MHLTKNKGFYTKLFALALPIALQNLVTVSIGLFDNLMVSSISDSALSGVYTGNQIATLLQILCAGIEGALLVLGTQYYGKGDGESVKKIISAGTRLSLIIGLLFSVICFVFPREITSLFTSDDNTVTDGGIYLRVLALSFVFYAFSSSLICALRATEAPKFGLYVCAISLPTNIFLNFVLIYGRLGFPALGIRGAALATLITRIAETGVTVVYVLFCDKHLRLRIKDLLKFNRELLADFLKCGIPIMLGQLVWGVNLILSGVIMGRLKGSGVLAGLSTANALHSLAYVLMYGLSSAVGIITAKTVGEGDEEKMRKYSGRVQRLFLVGGLLTSFFIFLMKKTFISLYGLSPDAAAQADAFTNVFSFTVIGTSYQAACLTGLVKSGGDTSFVFKTDLVFVLIALGSAAFVSNNFSAAPWLVFACLKSDQILKCFVAAVKINHQRWMKNLTKS